MSKESKPAGAKVLSRCSEKRGKEGAVMNTHPAELHIVTVDTPNLPTNHPKNPFK